MGSLEDKVVLVTGSTDGLGRGLARTLAERGATVLLHGRDEDRLEATADSIRAEVGGGPVVPYLGDLSCLNDVRRLAEDVGDTEQRLDVLVNNAGVVTGDRRELSADGYELTFAVNHLAHFLLSVMLLPLLRASAPARIVNVASAAQSRIDFSDVMLERGYDPMHAYSQSKLAQVMFTVELAERLAREHDERVSVNTLHPATLMDTKMVRDSFGGAMTSVDEGVEATLRLVAAPELEGVTGRYFSGTSEGRPHGQAEDPEARHELWALSEELTAAAVMQ